MTKSKLADKLKSAKSPPTNQAPHLIISALAGCGKTTTLIEGLKRIKGLPSAFTPSPQQEAIWEAMAGSRDAKSICFCAFNRSIKEELAKRMPEGCEAMTLHGLGLRTVTRAFGRVNVIDHRVSDILCELTGKDVWELRRQKPVLVKAVQELVGLAKSNLALDNWEELASYYDVETNGSATEIFKLVPKVLARCLDVQRDMAIDYDDMVWLPVALNLPSSRYDLLLVDEQQDLSRAQQALALASGTRLVLCGDANQAIYGFAGADSESVSRMKSQLEATERGLVVLPLTATHRCGKAIVEEARKLVPSFDYFPENPTGSVTSITMPGKTADARQWASYLEQFKDGDMVICRCNAPLVSAAFKFIRAGRKANILGRDIAKGLTTTIQKLKAESITDLITKLGDWHHREVSKEQAKRNPSEARVNALDDRMACLSCFIEGSTTVDDVLKKVETIFTDNKASAGIRLSSVHKAKGLESSRVFFLKQNQQWKVKQEWERQQLRNLEYVGITRAINELIYVYEPKESDGMSRQGLSNFLGSMEPKEQ